MWSFGPLKLLGWSEGIVVRASVRPRGGPEEVPLLRIAVEDGHGLVLRLLGEP